MAGLPSWCFPGHSGTLSYSHPPVKRCNEYWGKKRPVVRSSVSWHCYQYCRHTGLLCASLIASNFRQLKGKRGWGPSRRTSQSTRKSCFCLHIAECTWNKTSDSRLSVNSAHTIFREYSNLVNTKFSITPYFLSASQNTLFSVSLYLNPW